jgi:hypothetical protein
MRPLVVAALACACLLGTAPAAADPPSTDVQAHQAYERGTSAYRRKDYATAAREYAAADALSPNPVALQAAIDAAVQADDPVLGLQLLERAKGAPRTSALLSTMLVAEQKFAHRTGRVGITCPAQPCLATIDGAAIDPSRPTVVRVGAHSVMVESGGSTTTRSVTVPPDETVTVAAAAPSGPTSATPSPAPMPAVAPPLPPPPPVTSDASGLSPVWFLVGVGATVVAGGVTIGSAVDTASQSSGFNACRAAPPQLPTSECDARASSGQSAQARTNVLVGVTAVLGVATVALIPFIRWHGMTAAVTAGGLAFDARF